MRPPELSDGAAAAERNQQGMSSAEIQYITC